MNDGILENFLNAMEFPKVLGSLALDCQTASGREMLVSWRPLREGEAIQARLDRTRDLEKHQNQSGPPMVPDPQFFLGAFEKARTEGIALSPDELAALIRFLSQVVGLRQYLSPETGIPRTFQDWLERLNALPALQEDLRSKVSDKGEVLDSASPELKSLRDRIRNLRAEVQDFYRSFLQQTGVSEALQERLVTEREGRWVVPVKRERQSQVPGFVHGLSASGSTLFVEPREVVESNHQLKSVLLQEDEEIRRILREATQRVLQETQPLLGTLQACAEVDVHGVLAFFATRFDGQFIRPQGGELTLKDARHPLLALEAQETFREKVVPLGIAFSQAARVVLVSGPNAGGKTVVLKTLGLACVMAQTGLPVLAKAGSELPNLHHFDTDLSDGQSLEDHLSTYAAKLRALHRMVEQVTEGSLFLLDELGAGTDPKEGGALGLACLETLQEKGAFVLANTHQPLLKLLTGETRGMANAAMAFDEVTGKPTFRLVMGIPGQSHAFTLAQQMGFDETLLEKAKAHLPEGEADLSEILAKLAREKQLAETSRLEAEKARQSAKKLEAELLTARRQMKDEARRIRKQAQEEAEGLLRNTRRKMEHLIQGVEKPEGGFDRNRVKDARGEVDRKLRNLPPTSGRAIAEVKDLKPGDEVFFKPGRCRVKVMEADEDKAEAVIQMENGLKLSCKYADLGESVVSTQRPKPIIQEPVFKGYEEKGKLELDLRGKMVDQALPLLDKFLDDALLVDLPFVRIIHGKGTGALKEAIHQHLPLHHPKALFALAEPAQGGAGVTVIKFRR